MTARKISPVVEEELDDEPEELEEEVPSKDIETLIPVSDLVTLESGIEIRIKPIRTRETLKLLKIFTRGGGSMITNLDFGGEDFTGQFVALIAFAVPEAEEETLDFLQFMCAPSQLIERRPLKKGDKERNDELWEALAEELENPVLEDTITIISTIVRMVAPDIQALGKRLRSMLPKDLLS